MNAELLLSNVFSNAPESSSFSLQQSVFVDGWSIATDGHRMLAIKGKFADSPNKEAFPVRCRKWIDEPGESLKIDGPKLREFIGKRPKKVRCDDCGATGKLRRDCSYCTHWHDCDCMECDGGYIDPPTETVQIGPAIVNVRLLDDIASDLTGDSVSVSANKTMITFWTDEWFLRVMTMEGKPPIRKMELPK